MKKETEAAKAYVEINGMRKPLDPTRPLETGTVLLVLFSAGEIRVNL